MMSPVVSVAETTVALRKQVVLKDVNLVVTAGEIVGIVGANGSGKSTLLRLIVGLVRPESGTVRIFGEPPNRMPGLRRLGAAIDAPALYPWMSGRTVLRTVLNLSGEPDRGRAEAALQRFGLTAAGRKPVARYSQGMRKRLALAVASVRQPDLLVLDEPTNALDERGRAIVYGWMQQHRDRGGTAVVVTHRVGDTQLCDRILRLNAGQLTEIPHVEWAHDPDAVVS